jgi:hypothetical protein
LRLLSFLLIAVGACLLALAGFDQFRGRTRSPIDATNTVGARNPDEFRHAMAYRWLRATLLLTAGVVLLRIIRAQERSDPSSPEFAGGAAMDAWSDSLKSQESTRKRP